jgi:hypothetical protein
MHKVRVISTSLFEVGFPCGTRLFCGENLMLDCFYLGGGIYDRLGLRGKLNVFFLV